MIAELSTIVKTLGAKLLEWRLHGRTSGRWEGAQFKAQADKSAHDFLAGELSCLAPKIPVISEEDEHSLSIERPRQYWLIDPIDGTASFAQGYSGFVTQVALIVDHTPHLAAIYAPVFDALYVAERNQGAFLNGSKLCCSHYRESKILIDNYPEPRGITLAAYSALKFTRYIECGSIALKICKVADGTADLFF